MGNLSAASAITDLSLSSSVTYFSRAETVSIIVCYQNEKGDQIVLTQSITEDHSIFLDNENGELSEITLSDMNISVYKFDDCTVGIWLQDEYAFHLTVYGDYDMDFIMKLVGAVKRQ